MPPDARSHADELMFQTVHQVEELWMKVMIHELGEMVVHCDADRFDQAKAALDRVGALGELLERHLKLFETMLPSAYLVVRKKLGRGAHALRIRAVSPAGLVDPEPAKVKVRITGY